MSGRARLAINGIPWLIIQHGNNHEATFPYTFPDFVEQLVS
jgi:hypothetical protein